MSISQSQSIRAYSNFLYALRAPETKRQYPQRFKVFLDFYREDIKGDTLEERINNLYVLAKQEPEWFQFKIIDFVEFYKIKVFEKKITGSTLKNYLKPIKVFCDMNGILLNWKLITRGMPEAKDYADDRPPYREEIIRLLEYDDKRIKPLVLIMISSGIRLGAFEYLKWKHIIPKENGCAKIIVYAGEKEEYYSFLTPEAYTALQEWMKYRASYGEKITDESWVMRNLWEIKNRTYTEKNLLANKNLKKLSISAIKTILSRALRDCGIREEAKQRHDFKAAHGFRKFFKTECEKSEMKSINIEILMGHTLGVTNSYYKPSEKDVFLDYLKAVDLLTINEQNRLKQKVIEYEYKSKAWEAEMAEVRQFKKEFYDFVGKK